MKSIRSAKQLTLLYFSAVAIAIIFVHASVFLLTIEDIEHLYAKNRLDKIHSYVNQLFEIQSNAVQTNLEPLKQIKTDLGQYVSVYLDFDNLPEGFPKPITIPYNKEVRVFSKPLQTTFFIMKAITEVNSVPTDVLVVIDNSLYELSKKQLFTLHTKQILISFLLLVASMLVVFKISERLTRPISIFAKNLADKSPGDLSSIPLPPENSTKELLKMVDTFNRYQKHICSLVERERSFNRYASHELRSPLMVMSGAVELLRESKDLEFVERQQQRLRKAINEMREFIDTLLSLNRSINKAELTPRLVSKEDIQSIIETHEHLLRKEFVSCQVAVEQSPLIRMPKAAFNIVVGNLVKNSFAYTEKGEITIELDQEGISVIDTGEGLNDNPNNQEGFGLGLLLVKDICLQYGWSVELTNNETGGCTAHIIFSPSV